MFERFTKGARAVVVMAQEEARSLRHDHVGTEHLLLGILAIDRGPAAAALAALGVAFDPTRAYVAGVGHEHDDALDADALATVGIDLAEVKRATEESFGPGALDGAPKPFRSGHVPFAPAAKKALELALREAVRRQDTEINDGHLLLGLLRSQPNPATATLRALGVDPDTVRPAVERELPPRAA